ncbi:MAG: head-tail connector protein [Pseudomonadota bacterium]
MINWPAKGPNEVEDFAFDWSVSLVSGETIATRVVVGDGVVVDSSAIDAALVRVRLSGGTEGNVARVTATITTSGGRTYSEVAVLVIGGQAVTLAMAKAHLRVETADDDTLIAAYLASAIDQVERHISKRLTPTIERQRIRGFPSDSRGVPLFMGPAQEILAVAYLDADAVEQALVDFRLVEGANGVLMAAAGTVFPVTLGGAGSAWVDYVAGYAPGEMPAAIVGAVLMLVAWQYSDRGDGGTDMPPGVRAMLSPYRPIGIG